MGIPKLENLFLLVLSSLSPSSILSVLVFLLWYSYFCMFSGSYPVVLICSYPCREKDLLLVPYWADRNLDHIQWPPFLLAGKVYVP